MLNLHFKRDSQPIDDDDLKSVIGEITRLMQSELGAEKDLALLLSKMVLRIRLPSATTTPGTVNHPATGTGVNRIGVRHIDIIAHVGKLDRKMADERAEFCSKVLGLALQDELPKIAGHVSDESFAVLLDVCAALTYNAQQSMLADAVARTIVAKAKGKRSR